MLRLWCWFEQEKRGISRQGIDVFRSLFVELGLGHVGQKAYSLSYVATKKVVLVEQTPAVGGILNHKLLFRIQNNSPSLGRLVVALCTAAASVVHAAVSHPPLPS